MNKLSSLKRFVPPGIFLATIGLGIVSVITSYRLQRAKQVTPKEVLAGPACDADPSSNACLCEWGRDNNQDDPWCCDGGDGGGETPITSGLGGRILCDNIPIPNAEITLINYFDGTGGVHNKKVRTDINGNWTINVTRPDDDNPSWTSTNVHVSSLPETISIPDGGGTIPSSQMQGPTTPNCDTWLGHVRGGPSGCSDCSTVGQYKTCRGYKAYLANYFVFRYTNCSTTTTPTPTPEAQCERCRMYDEDWNVITDLSTLQIDDSVYFATLGSTTDPAGITKARFKINGSADASWCSGAGLTIVDSWCETILKHGEEFYVPYTIELAGSYTIASMVYNPNLDWF